MVETNKRREVFCFYFKLYLESPLQKTTGGNVGIMTPLFGSSMPTGPPKTWEDPMSYPAINGHTLIENNTFAEFGTGCDGWRNRVIMTCPLYGDIIHPTDVRKITLENVDEDSKVCEKNEITNYHTTKSPLYCSTLFQEMQPFPKF